MPEDRWSGLLVRAAIALIAWGTITRLAYFFANRTLTLDEAMLALNIGLRDWRGLAQPLALEQTAPILFLWGARLVVRAAGMSEIALRAIPCVAGLALAPVVWVAARWLQLGRGALLAAALAALAPLDITYATTFKQYSVDALVCAVLLCLALFVCRMPDQGAGWWAWLIASAVSPLLSAPSVFVTAAALAAAWFAPGVRSTEGARARVAVVTVTWVAVSGINWWFLQRATLATPYLRHYWSGAFLTPPPRAMLSLLHDRAGWAMQEWFTGDTVTYPGAWRVSLLLLSLAGVVALWRRHGAWAAGLIAGPTIVVCVAASARVYPLSERTLLFLAPCGIVALVAGLESAVDLAPFARRAPAFAAAALILIWPDARDAGSRWTTSPTWALLRASAADLASRAAEGEPVYVFSRDVPIWAFYTTNWSDPDTARVKALLALAASTGPNSGNAPPRARPATGEGVDLVYRVGARTELIGIPTGIEALAGEGARPAPDAGWATNETARIRAVANPAASIFFTYCHNACDTILVDTLLAAGGRIVDRRTTRGVSVYQYLAR